VSVVNKYCSLIDLVWRNIYLCDADIHLIGFP
jgi:hypothetical protein